MIDNRAIENAALLIHNGHSELAISMMNEALANDPENLECHVNIGIAYRLTNNFQMALLHQKLATQLNPEVAVAWHNLGITHTEIGEFDRAFLCHQKAASLAPERQNILLAFAYALMRYGKFEKAWPVWEAARYQKYFREVPGLPIWNGADDLKGKKILVMTEGGYGDSILFLRWFPELQDRGAEVSFFSMQRLAPIFVGHPWVNHVLTNEEPIDPRRFDYCVSLMSLPAVLNCSADKIPAAPRYIMAHPDKVKEMRDKIYAAFPSRMP